MLYYVFFTLFAVPSVSLPVPTVGLRAQSASQVKPITIEQNSEFGLAATSTLKEYIREVQLILRFRIQTRELSPIEPSLTERQRMAGHVFAEMPQVFTRYRAEVIEPIKDLEKTTFERAEISFLQQAGQMRWRQYLLKANHDFPLLEPDGSYVLFLKRSDLLNEFIIEPQGVYALIKGRVSSPSRLAFARELRDRELRDFVKTIQDVVNEQSPNRGGCESSIDVALNPRRPPWFIGVEVFEGFRDH